MPLVLVIGGTRSGKSAVAERMAAEDGGAVTYVATAEAGDPEMAERIGLHRARRPSPWRTEEAADPGAVIRSAGDDTVLVDGLSSWLAALMDGAGLLTDAPVAALGPAGRDARERVLDRVRELAAAASSRPALTIVVAEEVGLGPVPSGGAGTRRFVDIAGEAAQVLSAAAARAVLVVAGRTVELDPAPSPLSDLGDLRRHGDAMVPPGAEDFAVNVELGGPPPWLREQLEGALAASGSYPSEQEAVTAVARRHGRPEDEVVLTNGAGEAFWLMAAALRSRLAVCVHPSFTEPEVALRSFGRRVERAFRAAPDFALDPGAIAPGADLVVTTNPNNPSGRLDRAVTVEALGRPGRVLVVDEAFMDFDPGEPQSLAGRRDIPGLVVVRSLTKVWSIPGVRAGYVLAPAPVAAALRARRPPWNVNGMALAALRGWAAQAGAATLVARRVGEAREPMRWALSRLPGVVTWPSAANFLLTRVRDGPRTYSELLRRGFAVRPAGAFPGLTPDHLRMAVREPAANRRLVEALAEVTA